MKDVNKMLKHELVEEFNLMKQDRDLFKGRFESALDKENKFKNEIDKLNQIIKNNNLKIEKLNTMMNLFLDMEYPLLKENSNNPFPRLIREDNKITRFIECLLTELNE